MIYNTFILNILISFSLLSYASTQDWPTIWGTFKDLPDQKYLKAQCYNTYTDCRDIFEKPFESFASSKEAVAVCEDLKSLLNVDASKPHSLSKKGFYFDVVPCAESDCSTNFLRFQTELGIKNGTIPGEDKALAITNIYTRHLKTPHGKSTIGNFDYWHIAGDGEISHQSSSDESGGAEEKPMEIDVPYKIKKCFSFKKFFLKRLICNTMEYKVKKISDSPRAYAVLSVLVNDDDRLKNTKVANFENLKEDMNNAFAGGTSFTLIKEVDGKVVLREVSRAHIKKKSLNSDLSMPMAGDFMNQLVGEDFAHFQSSVAPSEKEKKDIEMVSNCPNKPPESANKSSERLAR